MSADTGHRHGHEYIMKRIGEILTESYGLSSDILLDGLKIQDEKGGRIGEILIGQKALTETDVLQALGLQFGLKFLSAIPLSEFKTDFAEAVPIQFLKRYRLVPVFTQDTAFIATNDPLLFQPLDDLKLLLL